MFRTRKSAFTLIELLVVIAIVAILAALLFPVFVRAREHARATRCVSNLRQLAMAIHQYMQDWDGGIPEFWKGGERTAEQWVSFRWYGHLTPYVKNSAVLHCPSDSAADGLRAVFLPLPRTSRWVNHPAVPHLSYGLNFWLQQTHEITVSLPAETLLVADCAAFQCADARRTVRGKTTSCYAYANGSQAVDHASPLTGQPGQERHRGGSNVAFFDGHVRFILAEQFRKRRQGGNCFEYPLVEPSCQPWP